MSCWWTVPASRDLQRIGRVIVHPGIVDSTISRREVRRTDVPPRRRRKIPHATPFVARETDRPPL
jgi:hypothetical protein